MSADSAILLVDTSALAANIEEGTHDLCTRVERRPLTLLVFLVFGTVTLFAGGGPIAAGMHELFRPGSASPAALEELRSVVPVVGTTSLAHGALAQQVQQQVEQRAPAKVEAKQPLPAQTAANPPKSGGGGGQKRAPDGAGGAPTCGDGKCEPPESVESCFADCPGAPKDPTCGAELHMDPQGFAVVDGRGHHVPTADACCAACAAHAAKTKNKPCNSWVLCYVDTAAHAHSGTRRQRQLKLRAASRLGRPRPFPRLCRLACSSGLLIFTASVGPQVFCYMPHCWSADNGNTHLFGECWLKWQADPAHPLYGQRGKYTEEFRRRNRDKHLNGLYPPASDKHSVEAPHRE